MTIEFTLPKWFDLHVHLRQEALLSVTIQHQLSTHCAGVLAMPNTKPPVAKIDDSSDLPYWSIADYHAQIQQQANQQFEQVIVPLYLTKDTTPKMIEEGVESGLLKACKYYPPHGTTNADHGRHLQYFIDNGVFAAMQEHGVVLCIHGEAHDIGNDDYFAQSTNAEVAFYQQEMPMLREAFPQLKIVCEHITTKAAVEFVRQHSPDTTAATITPQHLLYTIADLLRGLKYHLYCLPLLKFSQDRDALRAAVADLNNQQFFAGTDSAPHTKKATECGCAAGCYTASVAPQLYGEAFELAGVDLSDSAGQQCLQRFLCELGPQFYGFPASSQTFTLRKTPQVVEVITTLEGPLVPLPVGVSGDQSQPVMIPWSVS